LRKFHVKIYPQNPLNAMDAPSLEEQEIKRERTENQFVEKQIVENQNAVVNPLLRYTKHQPIRLIVQVNKFYT